MQTDAHSDWKRILPTVEQKEAEEAAIDAATNAQWAGRDPYQEYIDFVASRVALALLVIGATVWYFFF